MPQVFDNFNTPIELAVTAGSTHVRGPSQPTGTELTGSGDTSVQVHRQISLEGTTNHAGAAAIVKDSPLVLLTTPRVDSPDGQGLQALILRYVGPPPTTSMNVDFAGSTGLSIRLDTAGKIKIYVSLFPTNGASARRWYWGDDLSPGHHDIETAWTDFKQVQGANDPGPPDGEPMLSLVVKFTITHPERTPLLVQRVGIF